MNQEIVKIEQEKNEIAKQVNAIIIKDQESYEIGASMKITLSTFRKKLNLFFDPMVSKTKAAYDEAKETRDKLLKPTKELEDVVKNKLKSHENKMAKEAEESRLKAEEEKQRKIDEENKRRKEEAEQKAKDEAEVMGVDEKEIEVEKVEEATAEDIDVEQPLPTIDKVKGLGIRRTWKVRILDKTKIPIEYLEPNVVLLNTFARAEREKFNIAGCEAYED